jgi:Tfp pilus assembly protein PilW
MKRLTCPRPLRLRTSGRDDGLSLAELVVTMFVGTMVLTVLGTIFTSARGATSGVSARTTNTQQQRSALDALTKNLRTAVSPGTSTTPFCYAQPTAVLFYANITPGGQPTLIKYSIDASGNLLEGRQPPPSSSTYAPCSTTTFAINRIVARNVTSTAVFTFNSAPTTANPNGVPLSFVGTPAAVATSAASGVTPDISLIDNVSIKLAVQTPSSPVVPPTTVTTVVQLPNFDYQQRRSS